MAQFNIKTITPVHIGSGELYQSNYEFLYFQNENKVALIDDERIVKLIGEEQIDHWLSVVENDQSLYTYLKSRSKEPLRASHIAHKTLEVLGKRSPNSDKKNTTIRGQLKSGSKSTIAGSSLKGSIRTALLTYLIDQDDARFYENRFNLINKKEKFADDKLMRRHFGEDPNHDILRLLRIGDAIYDGNNICLQTSTINLYGRNEWKFKDGIDQYIECIPQNASMNVRIQFNELLHEYAQKKTLQAKVSYGKQPETYKLYENRQPEILELKSLFNIVNEQTSMLLNNELNFWDKQNAYPKEIQNYIGTLEDILQDVNDLIDNHSEKEICILRLGWGTGFRNMTGDWQEDKMTDNDLDALIRELRPKHDITLTYPKTRRMAYDGTPLGFVKIEKA